MSRSSQTPSAGHEPGLLAGRPPAAEYVAFAADHDPDPQVWTPTERGDYAGLDHGVAATGGNGGAR